jgi:regulator of cell morphogenesis and NO signaling
MMIQKENKIGEVVAKNFHTVKVFENFGLDFCCGGKKSIKTACEEKGINADNVMKELSRIGDSSQSLHFNDWELDFLIDYIVNNHHSYVVNSVSTIEHHIDKVIAAHGEKNPEVVAIGGIFGELKEELLSHMQKEEKMLFPYIKKMLFAFKNSLEMPFPPFGSVGNPVKMMEHEHDHAGKLVHTINELSKGYTPPESACTTFRVLYQELKEFEADLHTHIHLENNILFPKSMQLEQQIQARINRID